MIIATLLVAYLSRVFGEGNLPSSANCTWTYIDQPLSHFERGDVGYYKQRLCVYDGYWEPHKSLPVFLYTGNESPVDEYVNNTGLMWELAEKHNALIVFAEHRYFGDSVPTLNGVENCIKYLTSEEALADYASLCNRMRRDWGAEDSAVIAFGGSYGGMLASWLRILYPSAIDGAIAASAPVLGFPLDDCPLDGSAQVVTYSASEAAGAAPLCAQNLKSSYVLISEIGSTATGRAALSDAMNLCTPLDSTADITSLLYYLQSPLFNLAEGSYPFPSSYITFALTDTDAPLPAWAMQVLCETAGQDFGASISGSQEDVKFTVSIGGVNATVNWDQVTGNGYSQATLTNSGALELAAAVAQSVQVWYNVTGTLDSCIDWSSTAYTSPSKSLRTKKQDIHFKPQVTVDAEDNICTQDTISAGNAWNALTCTEGLNLINWRAQGVGNDLYWPPNQEQGYSKETIIPGSLGYCPYLAGMGLYGVPSKGDDWSFWLDTAYGGSRMQYASNIVYSNGNLDPWMPAGVSADKYFKDSQSIKSLLIDMGGHHLDLFFSNENDPQSVKDVRTVEEEYIVQWINEVAANNNNRKK